MKAVKSAKNSNVKRGKVSAIAFTNSGQILAQAHNCIMLGGIPSKNFTIHAEQFLLAKLTRLKIFQRYSKNDINIFVLRYKNGDDTISMARPCPRCEFLLKKAGIRVFYTNYQGNIEEMK